MLGTVVWACDGRPRQPRDLAYVRELCRSDRCRLWIVHVVQSIAVASGVPLGPAAGADADADARIDRLKAGTRALRADGIDASLQVIRGAVGSPAAPIMQFVRDVDADLLVVGAAPRDPAVQRQPGATATRLVVAAGCAVLWLGVL